MYDFFPKRLSAPFIWKTLCLLSLEINVLPKIHTTFNTFFELNPWKWNVKAASIMGKVLINRELRVIKQLLNIHFIKNCPAIASLGRIVTGRKCKGIRGVIVGLWLMYSLADLRIEACRVTQPDIFTVTGERFKGSSTELRNITHEMLRKEKLLQALESLAEDVDACTGWYLNKNVPSILGKRGNECIGRRNAAKSFWRSLNNAYKVR